MDFELRAARQKLEREQRERKERARQRLERERRAKADATGRREAVEAVQSARRLDAARAQQLVEQQIEESLLIGKGVVFCRTLEALHYNGYGDKIKLPPSCFSELSNQGALDQGPMYFRLSEVDGSASPERMTHSGVLEFTANEGSVELPSDVWCNLFSHREVDTPLVEVRYVSLPKGTYAKLQPEEIGFADIPYHKAVLETSLRRHATLSRGDIITVNHGDFSYNLQVIELKPSSSVSVIETDMEVDVVEPRTSDSKGQHALIPLVLGKVESGIIEEGNFNYYKFSLDDAVSERMASGDLNLEVNLEADASDGDTNIYVSRYPVVFPTQHQHEWSSHDLGSKVLVLVSKDAEVVAGTYSVGVFGYKGLTKYRISVTLKEKSRQRLDNHSSAVTQKFDTDLVECRNCRHQISSQSIMIHEAFCFRHNVVCQHEGCGVFLRKEEAGKHVHCDKCGRAFKKEEMEKHMVVFHQPVHCPCGAVFEKEAMVEHQSAACPLRLITCRFCGDMVQAGSSATDARDRLRGLTEHESICGSRTAPCDSCGRAVMLKDMDIHVIAVHQKS